MAEVPTVYVKDKPVDYEREIFAILGEGVRVGSWHFRPPSLGVWALWEILDSPIIKGNEDSTHGDYMRLLWVNSVRREAVREVALWVEVGKPEVGVFCELDEAVMEWAEATLMPEVFTDELQSEIFAQLPLCFTGYELIPKGDGGAGPWLFAGEAFGAICGATPENHDTLVWDTPMTLLGHSAAFQAKCNGAKGIGRPKDEEDIKEQLRLANEREEKGEIHPWQEVDPRAFPITAKQAEHPATVARFEELLRRTKK